MSKWAQLAKETKAASKRKAEGVPTETTKDAPLAKKSGLPSDYKEPVVASMSAKSVTWNDLKFGPAKPLPPRAKEQPAKLMNITTNLKQPFILKLTEGGEIVANNGVKLIENSAKEEYYLKASLGMNEHRIMKKLCDDFVNWALKEGAKHYPPETTLTSENVRRFYTLPKAKEGSTGEWPSALWTKMKAADLTSSNPGVLSSNLIVTNEMDENITILPHMMGMLWDELKIEFQYVIFGWMKNEETKVEQPMISMCSRLRRAKVKEDVQKCHMVFPHQVAEHDAHICHRRHHVVDMVCTRKAVTGPDSDLIFHPLVSSNKKRSAQIERKDGSLFFLGFNGGGSVPAFAISENLNSQTTFTFTLRDKDEIDACLRVSDDINQNVVLVNRTTYYPGMAETDDRVKDFFRPIVQLAPLGEPDKLYDEPMITGIFYGGQNGGSTMFVDEDDVPIKDPRDMVNRSWSEVWIAIYGLYVQTNGNKNFKTATTKRVVYVKLAPQVAKTCAID